MFVIGLVIGLIFGTIFAATCFISNKQEPDDTYEVAENNLKIPSNDVFKNSLKIILVNDIEFYNRMYQVNRCAYYLGRLEQSKFILKLMEGENVLNERKE